MNKLVTPILRLPKSVVQDTRDYRLQVDLFLQGKKTPVSFQGYRVPMGVYEQRMPEIFMVRTRLGAGLVLPEQLKRLAALSKTYGNGKLHVTTRQAIQIHDVSIEDTPAVLEGLLEVGLSSRGGGGNTVRNITCCAWAGLCAKEPFDVTPHTIATAEYLLQSRGSFNLPRKYKIVFSGCPEDCGNASIADLGFFAHQQEDGQRGFSVYAAGGLGSNPRVGIRLEDFVPETEVFAVAEAIKRLFDQQGDRSNKRRARLRYVLERVGVDEFRRLYRQQREKLAHEGLPDEVPTLRALSDEFNRSIPDLGEQEIPEGLDLIPESKDGLYTVRLNLALGDISADDMLVVADCAQQYARGCVRCTQTQNLLLSSVPRGNLKAVAAKLSTLSRDIIRPGQPTVVACAGAATCRLGLCRSRGLAAAVTTALAEIEPGSNNAAPIIRISGCPNGCGQHVIGMLGFQGRARRINGRLMPWYDVYTGGRMHEGDARLAHRIGSVPAKRIGEMLKKVFQSTELSEDQLKGWVDQYSQLNPDAIEEDLYTDFDMQEPFSLAGRGPGECGAGVMDVMQVDIDSAHRLLKEADKADDESRRSDLLYQAIVAGARSLLYVFGLEPQEERDILEIFSARLVSTGWIKTDTKDLLDRALDYQVGEKDSLAHCGDRVTELVARVEVLFKSLDANLRFTAPPCAQQTPDSQDAKETLIDLRGVTCPLNFVKAKLALEKIDIGQVLEVWLDDGEPVRNVPASFEDQGQAIVKIKTNNDYVTLRVRRVK